MGNRRNCSKIAKIEEIALKVCETSRNSGFGPKMKISGFGSSRCPKPYEVQGLIIKYPQSQEISRFGCKIVENIKPSRFDPKIAKNIGNKKVGA